MNPLLHKSILIVDDEQDVRETISEALELNGFKTIVSSNGEEALKILSGLERKPALILLDLMMPVMDGFEFMRNKDLTFELGNIPTVVISADGRVDTKLLGFNTQGYLRKPINLGELLKTAERYCG